MATLRMSPITCTYTHVTPPTKVQVTHSFIHSFDHWKHLQIVTNQQWRAELESGCPSSQTRITHCKSSTPRKNRVVAGIEQGQNWWMAKNISSQKTSKCPRMGWVKSKDVVVIPKQLQLSMFRTTGVQKNFLLKLTVYFDKNPLIF